MPRIAEARPAAEPSSPPQKARYRRMLHAAADLAAEKGLDRVQMHDVAKDAGVAIGTLYRYFPSKTHLFTAVMADQVEQLDENTPRLKPDGNREEAVYELLVDASRHLLRRPGLAIAMVQSINIADADTVTDAGRTDKVFRRLLLRTLGIEEPTEQDVSLVRLLLLCWYGVLTLSLNGRMSQSEAESDIRLACGLLVPRFSAARGD